MRIPDETPSGRDHGLWLPDGPVPADQVTGHGLFDGPFGWPVLVVKRDAVHHNVTTLADYCARHGMELAPHGKSTMAPKLFAAQLDAGAWGMTLASAQQVLAARSFGMQRILLANELLDARALRWLMAERERDPAFEFVCYVDSVEGVRAIAAALAAVPGGRDFTAVLEVGYPGGRTGVRNERIAFEVARAAAEVDRLSLIGVAGYEGGLRDPDEAREYLLTMVHAADQLAAAGLLADDGPVLLSAGGSAYFDVVADVLAGHRVRDRDTTVVLRSGSYVTHDDGVYVTKTPFTRIPGEGYLMPALEVWAQVLSVPEPNLALVGMGKRDAPYDEGLPVPTAVRRASAGGFADPVPATGLGVFRMDDQHGYVDIRPEVADDRPLAPGDLIGFGISHPCTAFDKWRVLPVVDDGYRVVDLVHTYF